jgi:hypothetical protein
MREVAREGCCGMFSVVIRQVDIHFKSAISIYAGEPSSPVDSRDNNTSYTRISWHLKMPYMINTLEE